MSGLTAVITIPLDPSIQIGPISLAWHGLMTAVGIAVGTALALRFASERGLSRERIYELVLVVAIAGFAGARVLYLVEHDPGALLTPGQWFSDRGYSFYGALVAGPLAVAIYLRVVGAGIAYLDALAAGFGLAMAIGRIGDVISGEHFGPQSTLPWAIQYSDPDAEVPSLDAAYHPGGLYEAILGAVIFAVIWPLRDRFRTPGVLFATVVALYSMGRFAIFFVRSDSDQLALGLSNSQWISLALIGLALGAIAWLRRRGDSRAVGAAA
jgi:phosphatidylglycerol---prolipoprotein diacylglyceryl transferase